MTMTDSTAVETPAPSLLDRLPEEVREQFVGVLDATPPVESPALETPEADEYTDTPAGGVSSVEPDASQTSDTPSELNRRERGRLTKAEEEESIRADERARFEAAEAQRREQDDLAQRAEQQRQATRELASKWNPPADHYQALDRAITNRDWNALDSIVWTDEKGVTRQGFSNLDDALDYKGTLETRSAVNTEMLDHWKTVFQDVTGSQFGNAAKNEGVDKSIVLGKDIGAALQHLYDAGKATASSEWESKYNAVVAELNAIRGKPNGLSSPEAGGQSAAQVGPFSRAQIAAMSPEEFQRNRAAIYAQLPAN